jgi:hypothetical protein
MRRERNSPESKDEMQSTQHIIHEHAEDAIRIIRGGYNQLTSRGTWIVSDDGATKDAVEII